jgi:hypothetical protein
MSTDLEYSDMIHGFGAREGCMQLLKEGHRSMLQKRCCGPAFLLLLAGLTVGEEINRARGETAKIAKGQLSVLFRDNSRSPRILSGVQSLVQLGHAKDFSAFDPDSLGAAAGLNSSALRD